jgi:6-phosphogluconolactonase (cycloisomerase 2 family)
LKLVEHESTQGRVPRNFALDPSGKWLVAANEQTDNIVVFKSRRNERHIDAYWSERGGRCAGLYHLSALGAC